MAFPAAHNTADHSCQGVHVPGLMPCHLFWIELPQTLTYATIDVVIVTHGQTALICGESESVPMLLLACHIFAAFLKRVR